MVRLLHLRSLASLALQLAILCVLIAAFFVRMPQVSGLSMEPHISSGEYVVINTLAYRFSQPKRGDIVAFRHDGDTPEIYIKRVIGLPGDRVRIDRGALFLNGQAVDEPYVHFKDQRSFPEVTVPSGDVFVLGDNRANSEDSRFFGPVTDDHLIGRALAGIWPLAEIGAL
ncbi:MAG TPA: signal peptidase I [Candidatus Baltobacteraceae bacterium]|nr:signal peptidase I [Candidatus Baltobacteraceae bacterium]